MDNRTVGILGGGQLGRMLGAAASLLNIQVLVLDSGDSAPAKQVIAPAPPLSHVDGKFTDEESVRKLASQADVLTVEIEHVNAQVLQDIMRDSSRPIQVHPHPSTIKIIQNKLAQKRHLTKHGVPVVDCQEVIAASTDPSTSLQGAIKTLGLPLMLKSQTLAYDGRGNYVIKTEADVDKAQTALGDRPLYAERWAPFVKELAVMIVRSASGTVVSYPAVETVHKDNICHLVFAPLRGADKEMENKARRVAEKAIQTFEGAGVFGVEMFLMPDGEILVNEIAPRPHNSGHYTIEACYSSQYDNHLRAILDLPLGSTELRVPAAVMLNLIGASSDMSEINRVCQKALTVPGAAIHLYGKSECRKGRKMGHITIVGNSEAEVRSRLRPLLEALPDNDQASTDLYAPLPPQIGFSHRYPLVGVIMGSDSDLPVMLPAARILDKFSIPYELTIVSAHRTPDRMDTYAKSAAARGLRVIIAGAGGAAHLPGMVASMTALPVIGVPVKGSSLDGVDSLHSIVQMPRGVPVATVGINNSTNAGLLAARILGTSDPQLLKATEAYSRNMEKENLDKVDNLATIGWEKYQASQKTSSKAGASKQKAIEITDSEESEQEKKKPSPAPKPTNTKPKASSPPKANPKPKASAASRPPPSDSDEDMEEARVAKANLAKAAKRKSVASSDDEEEEDIAPPKKKAAVAKPRKSSPGAGPKAKPSASTKPKAGPSSSKPKAPAKKSKKSADDDFIDDGDDDEEEEKKPKPAQPDKKPNWAAVKAAQMARNAIGGGGTAGGSGGTKAIPDGEPNCLAGLTFVFTGELPSFSREEAQDAAKRFGGRVTGAPSAKTSYVVVGENAGPKKLQTIKDKGLKMVDEDGFLNLIATRKGVMDAATIAKMEKEQEKIRKDAKEMEMREKAAAKDAKKAGTATAKVVDPNSQLWTQKYAPQSLKEICGNKGQVEKLSNWLANWEKSRQSGFKKPGKDGMGTSRAVLISGPPGIGKTTSAHLVVKLNGYTPIEVNASDARNKKLIESSTNITNRSLDGWLGGQKATNVAGVEINGRPVLIMDEVDGMSAGDRGGVGALNALIKKTEIPIICIANDRNSPKMKPLQSTTFALTFKRPTAAEIRSRLQTIAFKEKLKTSAAAIDALAQGSNSDIRQILNMMSTWKLSNDSIDFDQSKDLAAANEKHSLMTPFVVADRLLGPYTFSNTSRMTLADKMDLYFHDFSLVPLMIQENYLKTTPRNLTGLSGDELALKSLEILDEAASAISDGDLVDAMIHSPEQHWSLMPLHAVHSTVRPAAQIYGGCQAFGPGPKVMSFPSWLGQNSKQTKLKRQLGDIQIRMRLKVTGDKEEIRQQYIPSLFPALVQPLIDQGSDAVPQVIEVMDEYFLSKDEWDYLVELGVGDRHDEAVLKRIPTAVKTAFTRKYNSSDHPVAFHKATLFGTKAKAIAAGPAPDVEDAYDVEDESLAVEADENDDEENEDISKDKLIKESKPKKAAGKAPTKGKPKAQR